MPIRWMPAGHEPARPTRRFSRLARSSRPVLAGLVLGFAVGLASAPAFEAAAATYSLSGYTRAQLGRGIPIPVTFAAEPQGRVVVPPGATVMQAAGPDPKAMTLVPGHPSPLVRPGDHDVRSGRDRPALAADQDLSHRERSGGDDRRALRG